MIGLGSQYLTAAGFGRYRITAASLGNLDLLGTYDWLTVATKRAILGAFRDDGMAVINATNAYLNGIAASDRDKATALAALINEDPMMVCSLPLTISITMPSRYIYGDGNVWVNTGIKMNAITSLHADVELKNARMALFGSDQGSYNGFYMWDTALWLSGTKNFGTMSIVRTHINVTGTTLTAQGRTETIPTYGAYDLLIGKVSSVANSTCKFYQFEVNGKNLVPFKHKDGANTIACFLDIENMVIMENQGTGQFTIPDISYTPSTP